MTTAVSIDHVSKSYRLGVIGGGTLHGDLSRWWARVRGRPDPYAPVDSTQTYDRRHGAVWALRDLSLDVSEGQVLGIIGRNGAGKSTLLKILSRVTAPTTGTVRIRGRVGSLLEVGTGFHQELTGRENIYLNGAILGMRRREVRSRLDAITEFAEVGQYLDTPVKRYSSGMYVRLAFAVAAHLEPDVLIVDEVLSVGDAAFQKKCLGRMDAVAKGGRTVLFVSHNMGLIRQLCPQSILIDRGRIVDEGPSHQVVARYLTAEGAGELERSWPDLSHAPGDETIRLRRLRVSDASGRTAGTLDFGDSLGVEMEYDVLSPITMSVGVQFTAADGSVVFRTMDWDELEEVWHAPRPVGRYVACCALPPEFLNDGRYAITWVLDDPGLKMIKEQDLLAFEGRSTQNIGGKLDRPGVIKLRLPWSCAGPGEMGAVPGPTEAIP